MIYALKVRKFSLNISLWIRGTANGVGRRGAPGRVQNIAVIIHPYFILRWFSEKVSRFNMFTNEIKNM